MEIGKYQSLIGISAWDTVIQSKENKLQESPHEIYLYSSNDEKPPSCSKD